MTRLLVEELREGTELIQPFKMNINRRVTVGAFIPYLYMHNSPVGNFIFGVRKTDGSFFYEQPFTCDDIKNVLDSSFGFAHVFMPFIPQFPMMMEIGEYEMYLTSENYYYNRGSFIGWIKQFENLNNELDYTPSNDAENPLAFRLKVYKEGIL